MAIAPEEQFRLPRVTGVLREYARTETPADRAALDRLNYKICYGAVVDGKVPAVRVGGGWAILGRDLPALAAHLSIRLRDMGMSGAKAARVKRASSNEAAVAA